MSQVLIRGVEEELVNRIKRRAKRRGVSMQKELHAILHASEAWDLGDSNRTVYPPVRPVAVKGKPASEMLLEDRR